MFEKHLINRLSGILVLIVGTPCFAQDRASTLQLQRAKSLQAREQNDAQPADVPTDEQIFEALRATILQSTALPLETPCSYQGPGELHLRDDRTLRININEETLDETSGEVIPWQNDRVHLAHSGTEAS